MSTVTELVNSVYELQRLEEEVAQARATRDRLVCDYLDQGATVYGVAKLLGVSRQAVMKIRDSRSPLGDAL